MDMHLGSSLKLSANIDRLLMNLVLNVLRRMAPGGSPPLPSAGGYPSDSWWNQLHAPLVDAGEEGEPTMFANEKSAAP